MAVATTNDIKKICRNFSVVVTQTDHFMKHANEILNVHGCNIIIKNSFLQNGFVKIKMRYWM